MMMFNGVTDKILARVTGVFDLLGTKLKGDSPDRFPLMRDLDPSMMNVRAQRDLLDFLSPPYQIFVFDQSVASVGYVEIATAGKFVWIMQGGNTANYLAMNRRPNAANEAAEAIPMADGLFVRAPFSRLFYRVGTTSSTQLRIMVGQTDFAPGNQSPTGTGSQVSFAQAQPVYHAASGGTSAASQPVYLSPSGGTTAQKISTIPFTPAVDTTSNFSHVAARHLARVAIRSTTALGASATLTGTLYSVVADGGASGATQTAGDVGSCFSMLSAITIANQAGTMTLNGRIAGAANDRTILSISVAASTLKRADRHALGCEQVNIIYTNGGTAQGVFEIGGCLSTFTSTGASSDL